MNAATDSSFNLKPVSGSNVIVSGETTNSAWNNSPGSFTVNTSTGSLSSVDSLTSSALSMNWGYWGGTGLELNENESLVDTGGIHYIHSSDALSPNDMTGASGVIRYSLAGGTSPTDQTGVQGSVNNAQMLVDYGRAEILSLDMNLAFNDLEWLVYKPSTPHALSGADSFQNIALEAYQKDTSTNTLSGFASVSFMGTGGELAYGSYQLIKSSSDFGLSGALGFNQEPLVNLSDVFLTPVPLNTGSSDQIELLNLQGLPSYISSSSEFELPTYTDIEGHCGGASGECRLVTFRSGEEPLNTAAFQHVSWGLWSNGSWSIDSQDTNVTEMTLQSLPFITSPETDTFGAGSALSAVVYNANTSTMQLSATNAIPSSTTISSSLSIDFTSMSLLAANIEFSVTFPDPAVDYRYESPSVVPLAATDSVASINLNRVNGGNGSGVMMFSLVDTAGDDSMLNAISAFRLEDTDNDRLFWGTAAYSKALQSSQLTNILGEVDAQSFTGNLSQSEAITTEVDQLTVCIGCNQSTGTAVESTLGSHDSLGVSWGRWAADEEDLTNDDISLDSLHFIQSNHRTPDIDITRLSGTSVGTVNYSLLGGSAPTDQMGHSGQYNSASMGVDFGTQQINSLNIDMMIDQRNIILENSGITTIDSVLGGQGISIQSTSDSAVPGLVGEAHSVFIGTVTPITANGDTINVPQGVMNSFEARNGPESVSGAILLGNPSAP